MKKRDFWTIALMLVFVIPQPEKAFIEVIVITLVNLIGCAFLIWLTVPGDK